MGMTPFHGPPADLPVVPGFVVTTLIGLGGHGAVWAAREQISGDVVALKIGRTQDAGAVGAEHEADLLARLEHPHLIRLRRVVTSADGSTVLVLELAAGGSLAAVLAARGPLTPGEVVTLLVPLASALASLHEQGVAHGDLSPGNVLFSAAGRPMLGDLGVSSLLGARPGKEWSTPGFADPAGAQGDVGAADVWGLGALAWFALTAQAPDAGGHLPSSTPAELAELIRDCLRPDARRRPTMDDIAVRAWDTAAAVPIRLTAGRPPGQPKVGADLKDGAGRGGWPDPDPWLRMTTVRSVHSAEPVSSPAGRFPRVPTGRHLAGAVLGCVLTGAAALTWFLTSSTAPPASPASSPAGAAPPVSSRAPSSGASSATTSPASPASTTSPALSGAPSPAALGRAAEATLAAALRQIAQARATAFEQVSVAPLAAADEPGSPAEEMDRNLVRRLHDAGLRLDGVSYRIGEVQILASTATTADVEAVVTTSAHRQVQIRPPSTARAVAAEGPQHVRLRLVQAQLPGRSAAQWLVRSVSPAPAATASATP